jgi:hypothetical protein
MRLAIFLLGFVICSQSDAAIVYDLFIRTTLGDSGNFTVNPSQAFSGSVILRETITTPDASPLAANNLNFYRVNVLSNGGDGIFDNLTTTFAVTEGFANGNDANTLGFASISSAGQTGRLSTNLGGGVREIVLGTVDLTAPTIGLTTQFTLGVGDGASASGFLTTSAGSLPDLANASTGGGVNFLSTSITAVPEPGSVAVLSIIGCGSLLRFRKRLGRGLATA